MSSNLWPTDLGVSSVRSPVLILREQASFLEKSTNNIVSALVQQNELQHSRLKFISGNNFGAYGSKNGSENDDYLQPFSYYFYITAPTLGNYRYLLLEVVHGFDLYPVKVIVGEDIKQELSLEDNDLIVNNEQEFEASLARIFNSTKTRKVISALLSQVESA